MGNDREDFVKENEKTGEVMDTPERGQNTQIAASAGKFEDSPVFNFLNSLSPIKPVKPIHITQTINPLSFASIPSVFTSPHISSLRESRFLRRHQIPDPSKVEFSSGDGNAVDISNVNIDATDKLPDQQENLDPRDSYDEVMDQRSTECSNLLVDLDENSNYSHNSPSFSLRPNYDGTASHTAECAGTSSGPVYGSGVSPDGVSQLDQNQGATACDWENLIIDDSDMFIFESPNDADMFKKPIDPGTSFLADATKDNEIMHSLGSLCSGEQVGERTGQENLSTQPGETSETMEDAEMHGIVSSSFGNYPNEKTDYEHLSGLYRGMRRRCLDFEMAGALRNHLNENSSSNPSFLMQSNSSPYANDPLLFPTTTTNDSPRCALPGIGLHLNAIGTAVPKDYKIVNPEASSCGKLLIGSSSSINIHPTITGKKYLDSTLDVSSLERENDAFEDSVLPGGDASQAPGFMTDEEFNHASPKKKRKRSEQSGEGDTCKRCNCKKSKCLKLYCECFAAGVYCVEPCACIDCFNKPIHEETVLSTRKQIESRNPLAFAPKVVRGSDSLTETGEDSSNTPASARHKRGCNCKKSGCLKKYCECYQGGVGCSVNCRCEGCKNAYGRKDGTEAECEEDATNTTEKTLLNRSYQKTAVHNEHEQNVDSLPPATPLLIGRQSVNPLLSNKKPSKSIFPSIGSSSSSYASRGFGSTRFFQQTPKFDKQLETVNEDEIPDFLQEASPTSGTKSSSPNNKRVSPPRAIGTSADLRSSRKLVLQSISSFPSLTSNQ